MSERIQIGSICVDSGHVVVCDPAYFSWIRRGATPDGVLHEGDHPGWVKVLAGEGDGEYPVYATYRISPEWGDRRIESITVDFYPTPADVLPAPEADDE